MFEGLLTQLHPLRIRTIFDVLLKQPHLEAGHFCNLVCAAIHCAVARVM